MAFSVERLCVNEVVKVLDDWDMKEFVDLVKEKQINGLKLYELTEGNIQLWSSTVNVKKFIVFIQDLKKEPQKYLNCLKHDDVITVKETNLCSESQYQTVSVRKISQQDNTNHFNTVEEILKKITVPKSFLYRNHSRQQERAVTSYVPMDAGTTKKPKKFFRLSSYEYPFLSLKSRISKTENYNDRGYYSVKTENKVHVQKPQKIESRPKYKSFTSSEEFKDDHFYEDLCYNDIVENNVSADQTQINQVKPCMVKIQELFQSFKIPFFKKADRVVKERPICKEVNEREVNIYENNSTDMYDSIHVARDVEDIEIEKPKSAMAVEEYMEPVQVNKDYCDVCLKQKDDSLLGFIMNYFESRLGMRRVSVPLLYNLGRRISNGVLDFFYHMFHSLTDVITETNDVIQSEESETDPPCERVWEHNMAARPLPVPVENEPYYMNIDRGEAETVLMGQPDGTFVLRPSSQPNHAYTLSVSCTNSVHNVGIRRRPDGRLALGFARRGERSFTSITSLIRHHRKRRLLLVSGGDVLGATTLNESAQYYQTPSNIPIF